MMYLGSLVTFLKLVTWGAGITASTQILIDMKQSGIFERVERRLKRVEKVKAFNIGEEHGTVMGMTQYGKTYATLKTLERMKEGVLFFNPQLTKTPNSFIKADMNISAGDVWRAVKMGQKVDYNTSTDLETISKELALLVNKLYEIGKLDCRIAIDECHLLSLSKDKTGLAAGKRLATTGLSRGFKTIYISQRPATVDNSFYTQSTKHVVFNLGLNDYQYLKGLGFPAEEMKARVNGEKYKFVEFDQMTIKGAYQIG